MREWEQATWAQGISEQDVIRQVGARLAQRVASILAGLAGQPRCLCLAGKGHNGDDVRAACERLDRDACRLIEVHDPAPALGLVRDALAAGPALVVDGLFGIGLSRPLAGDWRKLVETINEARVPVLAVDTPSGLDADTGLAQGTAVEATITWTVGAPKRGLLAPHAARFVGRLEVEPDIGLIPCPIPSQLQWVLSSDFDGFPPRRPADSHKGSHGHLVVFAGSLGYHGAAVLASRAALRARPGLVTLVTLPDTYVPVASQLAQVMVRPWTANARLPAKTTTILIGPGLAAENIPDNFKAELRQLWQDSPLPVVADASALEWLPPGPVRPDALRVMTPHPGEAARLLESDTKTVQSDRPAALRELSSRWGRCQVVLKGRHTLVGCSQGELHVNSSGNDGLAQGGSGDVLAGFLAGLLAQPALRTEVDRTLRYAVWEHGAAADRLASRRRNWTMDELLRELGATPTGWKRT
jgi:ADP-dependent NAD(P)H-hydrate dehydratase / NAD(P)H-hydrate epimerase